MIRAFGCLLLALTVMFTSGCAGLTRRTPSSDDVPLTRATVGKLAGDYLVHLHEPTNPSFDAFELLVQLSQVGDRTTGVPCRLSIAIDEQHIHLRVLSDTELFSSSLAYDLIDGEIQMEQISRCRGKWVVLWGLSFLKAGMVPQSDGSLKIRRNSEGIAFFIILPFMSIVSPPDGYESSIPRIQLGN